MVEWMELTDKVTGREISVKPITVVFMRETKFFSSVLMIVYAGGTMTVEVRESIDEVQERMYYKPFWRWRR